MATESLLPGPIVIDCRGGEDDLLSREWLIANKLGAYASSTVVGVNTRRYHGLLVAATNPPVGRIVALNCLSDQLVLSDEKTFDLATFEFEGSLSPDGRANLIEFRNDLAATFLYRCGEAEVLKEIILAETTNTVAVRYSLISGHGGMLHIRPFVSLRDYHSLRRADDSHQMTYLHYSDGIHVEDPGSDTGVVRLSVSSSAGPVAALPGQFHPDPQWWYRFRHRADIARGQEGFEDLYTPGFFIAGLAEGGVVQLTACLDGIEEVDFDAAVESKHRRLSRLVQAVGNSTGSSERDGADETTGRLASAADVFIVSRGKSLSRAGNTILAGYHWFADWGRDAMISLAGLALETKQYKSALGVLVTFADAVDDGMIPNCFDERGGPPGFGSIDASLWFIIAADRYVRATGDDAVWSNKLAEAVEEILRSYQEGTRFGIGACADGLLTGGDARTRLTWMDAKVAGRGVTPRWGKCVEINSLWHEALRIAAERSDRHEQVLLWSALADRAAEAFEQTFWNEKAGCLYDCVNTDGPDASIRPNQILAVAGPHCLLRPERQKSIVKVVRDELLTPVGLRTLSPKDPAYEGRYVGNPESRDRAYHQGTVWPWLMGPFIEAYLKVHDFSSDSRAQAGRWLAAFDDHLSDAGVGFISEVFDGDEPHNPGGCIAQAWSVAEILRAKRLIAKGCESG